ncbi:MAG: HEPN domain-containing protein, partial [Crocinitomicaceae bacterium]|nr:HEPN domain-containing protein [Crocinitomicaceae bacterium]
EIFETAIGVGECAGVMIDLVSTLLLEAEEKLNWSIESIEAKAYSDSIYHAYSVFISSAKALLLDKGINSSTQVGIIRDFDEQYKMIEVLYEKLCNSNDVDAYENPRSLTTISKCACDSSPITCSPRFPCCQL